MAVVRYQSGETEMGPASLADWNAELARIRHFQTMEFRCQTQDRALVTALGTDEAGREVRVIAAVQGSTVRFIRLPGSD